MNSEQIKNTQKKLAQLVDDTLYPQGSTWNEIANLVSSNPAVKHYTLSEIEDIIGKKGYSTLVAVLRLSMPPYNLFNTTFELIGDDQVSQILTLNEYKSCVLHGGLTTNSGEYITIEAINRDAIMHLNVCSSDW